MSGSEPRGRSPLRLGAEVLSVALVAGLLGLLIWKLVHQEHSSIPEQVAKNEHPQAPDFTLERLDHPGKLSLASLRGKAVVLNFWASWCAPCRDEANLLQSAWQRYRGQNVVVLGVDQQDLAGDARSFAKRHHMTYPLVRDGPGHVVAKYGLTGVPETFFVDRRGRLVGKHIEGAVTQAQLASGIHTALAS
jgi:cytochrome c biogenesis protein CcmG/thiol:disulfide interchange protein DsbE